MSPHLAPREQHIAIEGEVLSFPLVRTPDGRAEWRSGLLPGFPLEARVIETESGLERLAALRGQLPAFTSIGGHWHDCQERVTVEHGCVELGWMENGAERSVVLRAGDSHTFAAFVLHWARFGARSRIHVEFIADTDEDLPGLGLSWVPDR